MQYGATDGFRKRRGLVAVALALACALQLRDAAASSIGIYADSAGTQACANVPPNTPTTLYVIATVDGELSRGVSGAEFRIEVENPDGWFVLYTPPDDAVHIGKPIDADGEACTGAGVSLAFAECRTPDAGSDKVLLGTVLVTHSGASPTQLWIKRHITPKNRGFRCPLLVECNAPRYEKHCVEPLLHATCEASDAVPQGPLGRDAVHFVMALNTSPAPQRHASPARHPERELVVGLAEGVSRGTGGGFVPLSEAHLAPGTRRAFAAARVAAIGAPFPECRTTACATEQDEQWCASVSRVVVLRFNHARTARRAAKDFAAAPGVELALPAAPYVVPRETAFFVRVDVGEGQRFTPGGAFEVELSKPARLRIELQDVSGRTVRTLHDAFVAAGTHQVHLSEPRKANAGGSAPEGGLYTLRVRAGGSEAKYKVVMADE